MRYSGSGRAAVAAVVFGVLALAGCAGTGAEADLSVRAFQTRPDYGIRQLELKVTNAGSEAVTVEAAHFTSTRFDGTVSFERPQRVPAGSARDLPVRLPAATCADGDPIDEVRLDVTRADGSTATVTVALDDADGTLARIEADDCLAAGVAAVAEIVPPSTVAWMPGAHAPAALVFTATPTGAGNVTLEALRGTVLLSLADASGAELPALPLDVIVTAGAPAEITVHVIPARCDPHVIAEDKRGTFFPLDVAVAGGPAGTLDIAVPDSVRASLYDFVADWCGMAAG